MQKHVVARISQGKIGSKDSLGKVEILLQLKCGGGQPKADTCGHVGEGSEAKCGRPHLYPYFDKNPNFSPDLA